ncbi:CRE_collapsed_G0031420.mRNA.1.CDS.1 [Saccharomyces cerevisiae]|nr:CRE_HP_G0036290.mRNA.1.CDS.1 [Saccharomyces cerevisiae]CAI5069514.1 CRE_HP_G0116850.mRNA.1.CDS.1 [Saccharomyces cerevisiae]CAI6605961.1 CRE_HP_G0036290.mRNA.1.CDS.1 [Saccharomyces cerevisiae]CAI6963893.1 CRE_HP_G0116850.mRNA.1.CDS.1 [Saccharomyces cerevisiae]CAI7490320.1 CRE_collapsed_G0031420.mRNA.1.CDS.1 [Saccharomyces cerevisiae]
MHDAESTVDSLLKELDNEMEQTKSNITQNGSEDTPHNWKLPLQEIGDDTMEMLVKHNTRSNATENSRGRSPSKMSTISNESLNLGLLRVNSELEESPAAVHQERIKNSVANGALGHANSPKVLNNLKNMAQDIDKLARDEEKPVKLSSSPLKFTLKSTQPLLSYPESPIHRSSIEIETNYDDEDEEEEDAYTCLTQSPQILHSPSRIPITNAVSINKLNLDFTLNPNESDKSLVSDTSVDSTGRELDTKTIPELPFCMSSTPEMTPVDEKCNLPSKLLNTSNNSHSDSRSPTASVEDLNISTNLPGADSSQNNPVTTDADALIENDVVRDLQQNMEHIDDAFDEKKVLDEGCSNEPVTFLGKNDTRSIVYSNKGTNANVQEFSQEDSLAHSEPKFKDLNATSDDVWNEDKETDANISTSTKSEESYIADYKVTRQEDWDTKKLHQESEHANEQPAIIPQKDSSEETFTELNNESEFQRNFKDGEEYRIVQHEESLYGQRTKSPEENIINGSEIGVDHGEAAEVNEPLAKTSAEEHDLSSSCEDQSVSEARNKDRIEEKEVETKDENIETEKDESEYHKVEENEEPEHVPLLPPLPRWEEIQFNEPFIDENDTSNDSIDLTRSMKPSDYISIWHIQEEEIKSNSPESIANSQFSQQSSITTASTVDSKKDNGSTSFKFKPRIVSRSRIYNPKSRVSSLNYYDNEDYILSNSEWNALDPMRRNTLISKRIQDNIRTQKGHAPLIRPSVMKLNGEDSGFQNHFLEVEQPQEHENIPLSTHLSEQDITTNVGLDEQKLPTNTQDEAEISIREIESAGDITFNRGDLLSLSFDEELGQDFANFLDALDHDSTSFNHGPDDSSSFQRDSSKKSFNSLWESSYELKPPPSIRKQPIAPDVLQKLLESDTKDDADLEKIREERITEPRTGLGIGMLKTPVKDVSIALAASIKGYEASFSDTDSRPEGMNNSDAITLNMFDDFEEDKMTPSTPVRSISPIKRHVSSPFKVVKAGNKQENNEINIKAEEEIEPRTQQETDGLKQDIPPLLAQTKDNVEAKEETITQLEEPQDVEQEFPEMGTLYLSIKAISTLALYGTKSHRATYAIVFDNGENVVQTPWESLPYDGNIRINKEFELPIDFKGKAETSSASSERDSYKKCVITLKCKYEKPRYELVEIVDKVPVGKSFFGKTKYKFEKKYVQKKPKQDEWDYLFAQDGSFARCEIEINEEFLKNVAFNTSHMHYNMINKWSRIADKIHGSKRLYELPRKAPHKVASLDVEACFLERTSAFEQFPKQFSLVNKIVSKYKLQQNIYKEGYLLQDGGDLKGKIENRFFKLHGSQLSGYHEISRKAKIDINLLKVTKVLRNEDIQADNGGQRNFTDWVLFNECFQLVFDDGERITFNAECSNEEKSDWYNKLQEVVELNVFHQPWVKKYCEKLAEEEKTRTTGHNLKQDFN